jgi:lipid II isoglutaminyl synthase (glutamine-hydrolysing)
VRGHVLGTYLHGPVLVRNAGLADHLLRLVVGDLPDLDDEPVRRLREERRAAAVSAVSALSARRRRRPQLAH